MAAFFKTVFGSAENNEEDVEDSNEKKPLTKEEIAAKRLAHLNSTSALIAQPSQSQPTTSADSNSSVSLSPNKPFVQSLAPNKKRKVDEGAVEDDVPVQSPDDHHDDEDDEMADLSEEMKLAMKLSMEDDGAVDPPPQSAAKAVPISRRDSFEYLSVMYILEVRHSDLSQYNRHIQNFKEFSHFITNVNALCIIDDDTAINPSEIEDIFIDRFKRPFRANQSSFKYLLQSYERCVSFTRRVHEYWSAAVPQSEQLEVIGNIKTCVVTFSKLSLSTPELAPNEEDFDKSRLEFQHILTSPVKGRDFPEHFLQQLFEEIEEDTLQEVLEQPLLLMKTTSTNVLRSNYAQTLNALIKLSRVELVVLYLMECSNGFWIPNEKGNTITFMKQQQINGHLVVKQSLLGGLLNLSFECPGLQTLFTPLQPRNKNPNSSMQIQSAFREYRLVIGELQNGVCSVINSMVKIKNKTCKRKILRLFSYFVYINRNRGKMRFDHKQVSSDGFMVNLNFVMLKMCEPIIKKNMLNKLDPRYFLIRKSQQYTTWEDSTRLSCDANELKEYTDALYNHGDKDMECKSNEEVPPNVSFGFTTEIFCLTLESLHLGFSCVYNEVMRLQQHISRMQREARANPMAAMMINMQIRNGETRMLAQVAHLMEPQFISMVGRFYSFCCKWLLHLSKDTSNAKQYLGILPEYTIEDMSRFFKLYMTEPVFVQLMRRGQQPPFDRQLVIQCLIYLMGPSTPIRNIYQRACLCEVLLYFLPRPVLEAFRFEDTKWNVYEYENHEFNRFESCKSDLVRTLLTLYTEVERTGSHAQYYEKFKFRTIITQILKFLFSYKVHQDNLVLFWKSEQEKFIGFLNMLINDLIYTLDHGFDGLTEIKNIESEPVNPNENDEAQNPFMNANPFAPPPQNEAMQRQENIAQLRDTIRHNMRLANESIELLGYVCDHTPQPFMDDLILPRIAVLVSVYLDRLAKGKELKVAGSLREDYNFKAKFLLSSVVKVFNKLCEGKDKEMFLDAIVEDEAHFREKAYQNAINWLRKKQLLGPTEIDAFEGTLGILMKKFEEKRNIEVMLGDIPSKYLDPIMQTLMSDPVTWKNKNGQDTNKYVMDRKVIERHLMNNPNNPFNREPLTKEDLIPDTELKQEIDEWIENTLNKHQADGGDNEEQKEQ